MDASDAILAQLVLDRGLDAQKDAQRGKRARVTPGSALAFNRKPRNMLGALRDGGHVGFRDADVFGRDVAPAKRIDGIGEGREQFGRLGLVLVRQNDGLAAAHGQSGHGVLVAHAARQPQRIAHRIGGIGIVPEARAPGTGAEMRRMQRDNRGQPALGIAHHMNQFMVIEIRFGPESRHACAPHMLRWTAGKRAKWGDRRGSNPRPPVPQTGALTN